MRACQRCSLRRWQDNRPVARGLRHRRASRFPPSLNRTTLCLLHWGGRPRRIVAARWRHRAVKHLVANCRAPGRRSRSYGALAAMEKRNRTVKHFISEQPANRRLRLRERCPWFESADNREPPVTHVARTVSPAQGVGDTLRVGERQPNIVIAPRSNSRKSLFGYADNRKRNVVQFNRMADNVARAAEGDLPVAIVQP